MSYNTSGKIFKLPGIGEIKLYPLAKIAEALTDAGYHRDPQSVRHWLKQKTLPAPIFEEPAKGKGLFAKMLWSLGQIDVIVKTAVECDIQQCKSMKEFSALVTKRLYEYNTEHYVKKIEEANAHAKSIKEKAKAQ